MKLVREMKFDGRKWLQPTESWCTPEAGKSRADVQLAANGRNRTTASCFARCPRAFNANTCKARRSATRSRSKSGSTGNGGSISCISSANIGNNNIPNVTAISSNNTSTRSSSNNSSSSSSSTRSCSNNSSSNNSSSNNSSSITCNTRSSSNNGNSTCHGSLARTSSSAISTRNSSSDVHSISRDVSYTRRRLASICRNHSDSGKYSAASTSVSNQCGLLRPVWGAAWTGLQAARAHQPSRACLRGRATPQGTRCADRLTLLVLVLHGVACAHGQARSDEQAITTPTGDPFPRPINRYGEDHMFGIMLGLIVAVGLLVVIGVALFAQCCTDDGRRRERQRRRWAAAVARGNGDDAEMPPPPEFHLVSPRMRRRFRRALVRWRRRRRQRRHWWLPVSAGHSLHGENGAPGGAAGVDGNADDDNCDDSSSMGSSLSSDSDHDGGDSAAMASASAVSAHDRRLLGSSRIRSPAALAVPPAYSSMRVATASSDVLNTSAALQEETSFSSPASVSLGVAATARADLRDSELVRHGARAEAASDPAAPGGGRLDRFFDGDLGDDGARSQRRSSASSDAAPSASDVVRIQRSLGACRTTRDS
eukprot:scpid82247/ scgid4074/ 